MKHGVSWKLHGSSWREHQMKVGLSTTAVYGDLSGYYFRNFRDKANNII